MSRLRHALIAAFLVSYLSGCDGTDQAVAPVGDKATEDFLQKSKDMMKAAAPAPKKKTTTKR